MKFILEILIKLTDRGFFTLVIIALIIFNYFRSIWIEAVVDGGTIFISLLFFIQEIFWDFISNLLAGLGIVFVIYLSFLLLVSIEGWINKFLRNLNTKLS